MGKAEKVGKPVERERKGMWGSVAIGVLVGLLVLLLGTFLAVLFSGYAEILIVQLLRVEQSETEGSQKYQALKFLGIGMGGMLLALQALIANKRAKAMENTATAQLEAHIGKPASYGLPEDSGAITGAYTKEEAAQWIAEYKTAMSAVSGSG